MCTLCKGTRYSLCANFPGENLLEVKGLSKDFNGVNAVSNISFSVEANSYVSYLEGCTAPMRDENQLHAAVVELVALDNAEIKYSTVQNWWPGDEETGEGGVLNFVTKRGICHDSAKISWTQVETGSSIKWKYPS